MSGRNKGGRACKEGWHPTTHSPPGHRSVSWPKSVCSREGHTAGKNTHLHAFTHFCCKLNYARRRQTPTLQVLAMPSADGRIVFPCTRSVSWIYPQNSPPKTKKGKTTEWEQIKPRLRLSGSCNVGCDQRSSTATLTGTRAA